MTTATAEPSRLAAPPAAAGADEACVSVTRGLCNVCGVLTDAKVVLRGGRVYLVKWCPTHGRTEALVSSDQDWYLRSLAYVKPGTTPLARSVPSYEGCPTSCGLCPTHEQHTCVPILEITGTCDLDCPVCLVDRDGLAPLSLAEVSRILDTLVRCEGTVNMLTLSGGEPTTHPDFLAIVDQALRPEIGVLSVSTNGVRLSRDPDLGKALRDRGVVVSLQLDGFSPETHQALRGSRALAEIKRRVVDQLLELGVKLSLTMTLVRGVNEGEVGRVLDLLFDNDNVVSVMLQPAAYTPAALRRVHADPMAALTIPDVVRLAVDASHGVLEPGDISPLPCSHPACFALTYLLKLDNGRILPLPRVIEPDVYVDVIKNQALMGTDVDTLVKIKDSLYALWSSSGIVPDRDAVMRTVKRLLLDLNALSRGASHREVLDVGVRNVKSIFIHHFMDRATFDIGRAMKCCNHYPQTDGRLLPACVRNNLLAPAARVAGA